MAKRKKLQDQTLDARYLERFQGLGDTAVSALIEMDTRMLADHDTVNRYSDGIARPQELEGIQGAFSAQGLTFRVEDALYYAAREEQRGFGLRACWWHAMVWLLDPDAGHTPIQAFVVRHGMLDMAERLGISLTKKHLYAIGAHHLKGGSLEVAYRILDHVGHQGAYLMRLRRAVVYSGEWELAVRILMRTHTSLTQEEQGVLMRVSLAKCKTLPAAERLSRQTRLQIPDREKRAHILSLIDLERLPLEDVQGIAHALGVTLTRQHLERALAACVHRGYQPGDKLAIAKILAQRYPNEWSAKLPEYLEGARDECLADGLARKAEAFGQECGKPLTAAQLAAFLQRSSRHDVIPPEEREYASQLLRMRIREAAEPDPAPRQPVAAA